MGGYLASREVLTAADRRQINYASGRYSADVCISRSHPGYGHVRASLLVLRFGRPFVVFSPSASETLSAGGRSLSVKWRWRSSRPRRLRRRPSSSSLMEAQIDSDARCSFSLQVLST